MRDDQRPVQTIRAWNREQGKIPESIHMMAYEVYCEVHQPQLALIEGHCRGGFGMGELVAFLYAHSFPKEEWNDRVNEAFGGIENV